MTAAVDPVRFCYGCGRTGHGSGDCPDRPAVPSLFEARAGGTPAASRFDGLTYDPSIDAGRLTGQLAHVYQLMADGQWRSLREIADAIGASETSVSARLRDLRKARFGSYHVERRRVGKSASFKYRVDVVDGGGP